MPIYSIHYTQGLLTASHKFTLAQSLTQLHCSLTQVSPSTVKVLFFEMQREDIYSAGEPATYWARVTAQVRKGRGDVIIQKLMEGVNAAVQDVVTGRIETVEVQIQVVEIEDWKTVMTNGSMNP